MTTILLAPIVGAYFRPPATTIIRILSINTPLVLDPEPTNPHDPNAIRVCLDYPTLEDTYNSLLPERKEQFDNALLADGWSIETLLRDMTDNETNLLHLGYIPRTEAPHWLSALATSPDHHAVLSFAPEGNPLCKLDLGP